MNSLPAAVIDNNTGINVLVRSMRNRDLIQVLWIEKSLFEFPWSRADFVWCLRQTNCFGMVAEVGECVVGYVVWELHDREIEVLNFAVHRRWQRHGIGRQLIGRIASNLSRQRGNRILLHVRETNLPAQLFFRAMDFRATAVIHNFYFDAPEDAYRMEYRYETESTTHRLAS